MFLSCRIFSNYILRCMGLTFIQTVRQSSHRTKENKNFDFVINSRIFCRAPGYTGDALSHAGCWHLYGVSSVSVFPERTSSLFDNGPFRGTHTFTLLLSTPSIALNLILCSHVSLSTPLSQSERSDWQFLSKVFWMYLQLGMGHE